MKNRTTASLLAFVFGGFGIHKFYLGQTVQGVFCLLFCWTYIPAFIALIEFIIYITMKDEEFNKRFN